MYVKYKTSHIIHDYIWDVLCFGSWITELHEASGRYYYVNQVCLDIYMQDFVHLYACDI